MDAIFVLFSFFLFVSGQSFPEMGGRPPHFGNPGRFRPNLRGPPQFGNPGQFSPNSRGPPQFGDPNQLPPRLMEPPQFGNADNLPPDQRYLGGSYFRGPPPFPGPGIQRSPGGRFPTDGNGKKQYEEEEILMPGNRKIIIKYPKGPRGPIGGPRGPRNRHFGPGRQGPGGQRPFPPGPPNGPNGQPLRPIDQELPRNVIIDYDQIEAIQEKVKRADKVEEFQEMLDNLKQQPGDPDEEPLAAFQRHMKYVQDWVNALPETTPNPNYQDLLEPQGMDKPSPGMSSYWGEFAEDKSKIPEKPKPMSLDPKAMTNPNIMKAAMENFQNFLQEEKKEPSALRINPALDRPPELQEKNIAAPVKTNTNAKSNIFMPAVDDFSAPIRWVRLDSKETSDGLAKVTDPATGKNRQYFINGTMFVPVTDYSLERLGISTTSTPTPVLTTIPSKAILRTVSRNVNMQTVDRKDWLVFESAFPGYNENDKCEGEGCQARCNKFGCESMCDGDTCASGCVGRGCNTFCKGPGCLSMCIGEGCSAKCNGMSCEARCRGKSCEANCHSFSCTYAIDGVLYTGKNSWDESYPQYGGNGNPTPNTNNPRSDYVAMYAE